MPLSNIKPTKAETCFALNEDSAAVEISFKYPDSAVCFRLVGGNLYVIDLESESEDHYTGQDVKALLDSLGVPVPDFISDFYNKGIHLCSLYDTHSEELTGS